MSLESANQQPEHFHSGFIAIIGAPNVGKSTLLNRILGQKISITSPKPQTTRNRILGVVHRPGAQMIFLDTPGVHKAKRPLNIRIVEAALNSLAEVDLVLLLADVVRPDPVSEELMVRTIHDRRKPTVLGLNKIDRIEKTALLEIIRQWSAVGSFEAIVPISALEGTQVDRLLTVTENLLPEGPPYFPDDTLTDVPERFVAAELIREKIFRLTGEEIPYAVAVTVESFKEEKQGALIRIHAVIHVERESQKGILIGKGGRNLKRIGTLAREEIEHFLGTRVFLQLFVRVQKNWSRDRRALRRFGY